MQVQVKKIFKNEKTYVFGCCPWMKYFANKRADAHEIETGLNTVVILHGKSAPITVFTSSN